MKFCVVLEKFDWFDLGGFSYKFEKLVLDGLDFFLILMNILIYGFLKVMLAFTSVNC